MFYWSTSIVGNFVDSHFAFPYFFRKINHIPRKPSLYSIYMSRSMPSTLQPHDFLFTLILRISAMPKFMDSHLITTTCSSSSCSSSLPPSSAVCIKMEKTTVANQVWPNDCYSDGGSESRFRVQMISSSLTQSMPLNGTSRRKMENSSSAELMVRQLCGIILSLMILNSVIILRDFYSSFRCILSVFKSFLRILSWVWNVWAATGFASRPIEKCCTEKNVTRSDHQTQNNLCKTDGDDRNDLPLLSETKKVIDGTLSNLENLAGSADTITGLFEQEEPSLAEVKEAFDMFDENKDGFIDAKELGKVLHLLGFMEASEQDCIRMIKVFDDNLDGRIDLGEFIKVMERSFC